jgi:hypothetical protein
LLSLEARRARDVTLSFTLRLRSRSLVPASPTIRVIKRFKAHKIRTSRFRQKMAQENAGLFVHWQLGMTGTFA